MIFWVYQRVARKMKSKNKFENHWENIIPIKIQKDKIGLSNNILKYKRLMIYWLMTKNENFMMHMVMKKFRIFYRVKWVINSMVVMMVIIHFKVKGNKSIWMIFFRILVSMQEVIKIFFMVDNKSNKNKIQLTSLRSKTSEKFQAMNLTYWWMLTRIGSLHSFTMIKYPNTFTRHSMNFKIKEIRLT